MGHSLIVGGTRGLGLVVAKQFFNRGDTVSIIGRNIVDNSGVINEQFKSYAVDITQTNELFSVLKNIVEFRGSINYCVFLQRYRGENDNWDGEFNTTLTATKTIIEYLTSFGFSHNQDAGLLMVSSVFSKYIGSGQPVSYYVMKAALEQLMRYYAFKLGEHKIRSNCVIPFTFLKQESESYYLNNPQLIKLYEDIVPLKRMSTSEDIANAISFLCSEKASFITGQSITVDGGMSLVWPEHLARQLTNNSGRLLNNEKVNSNKKSKMSSL